MTLVVSTSNPISCCFPWGHDYVKNLGPNCPRRQPVGLGLPPEPIGAKEIKAPFVEQNSLSETNKSLSEIRIIWKTLPAPPG